ncbi:MAG: methionyl-tRNA formyltransferase [Acidimicrobiia bacterium]
MTPSAPRAVFLGTPEAAVPTLKSLAAVAEVVAVVTRPDRPKGRSRKPSPPPVAAAARSLGIPVVQPATTTELTETLEGFDNVEVGIVTAYGLVIRREALAIPRAGFLNVHFSLLPRWRGASPVTAAIMAGDPETGVTIMQLDEGLDTGPIVRARPLVIGTDESGEQLTRRLAQMGADLLAETLPSWVAGEIVAVPQPETGVTMAPRLTKSDRELDLSMEPTVLSRQVRALASKPGATLAVDGRPIRILAARATDRRLGRGEIVVENGRLMVGAGSGGGLELLVLQPPGRKPMGAAEWLRGLREPPTTAGN